MTSHLREGANEQAARPWRQAARPRRPRLRLLAQGGRRQVRSRRPVDPLVHPATGAFRRLSINVRARPRGTLTLVGDITAKQNRRSRQDAPQKPVDRKGETHQRVISARRRADIPTSRGSLHRSKPECASQSGATDDFTSWRGVLGGVLVRRSCILGAVAVKGGDTKSGPPALAPSRRK